jgi:hypothetical protein
VPLAVVEEYFKRGVDGSLTVDGAPLGRILIEPSNRRLAVEFPAGERAPDVVNLQNVSLDLIEDGGDMWQRVGIRVDDNVDEVYALVCALLDRVQLSSQPLADAVEEALASLEGILATRRAMTTEKQVGLFGELLALSALVEKFDAVTALTSWRGPLAEEHDFGLPSEDVEVKTTLGERRAHWISTSTQLQPTGVRPLYLLSIQLTSAAVDSGSSLPGLVERVRALLQPNGSALDGVLTRAGYHDSEAELYGIRWVLRSPPSFFLIDESFPALTQRAIDDVISQPERILDLRYRIDLTGLRPAAPLFIIGDNLVNGAR